MATASASSPAAVTTEPDRYPWIVQAALRNRHKQFVTLSLRMSQAKKLLRQLAELQEHIENEVERIERAVAHLKEALDDIADLMRANGARGRKDRKGVTERSIMANWFLMHRLGWRLGRYGKTPLRSRVPSGPERDSCCSC